MASAASAPCKRILSPSLASASAEALQRVFGDIAQKQLEDGLGLRSLAFRRNVLGRPFLPVFALGALLLQVFELRLPQDVAGVQVSLVRRLAAQHLRRQFGKVYVVLVLHLTLVLVPHALDGQLPARAAALSLLCVVSDLVVRERVVFRWCWSIPLGA